MCQGSARPAPPKARGEYRGQSSAPRERAGWPEQRPGRRAWATGSLAQVLRQRLGAPHFQRLGSQRATLRPPTTPGREWRQQFSPRWAAWAYRPAGSRQVDPRGRTLLPARDPPASPGAPLRPGRSTQSAPQVTCPVKAQSARSPGSKSVDSVEPKATFLGEGSPTIESRITLQAERRRQQE